MIKAMDEAGVTKSVLVQASSAYAFDNSYVADAVAARLAAFFPPKRHFISIRVKEICGGPIAEATSSI
jgi:hypothetical protein